MPSGDRYSLDAYLMRFTLEPSIVDLVVEGRSDVGFFVWYLDQEDLTARVFAVDDLVDIEADLVLKLGLDVGARGRAMALGVVAESRLGPEQRNLSIIVDADFGRIVGPLPVQRSCVLMTDDCALENYALNERTLSKFLAVHLQSAIEAASVLRSLTPALQQLLAVRIVFHHFQCGVISDPSSCCHFEQEAEPVDVRDLATRSLTPVRRSEHPAPIDTIVEMIGDYVDFIRTQRQIGRGHDIAPLLRRLLGISTMSTAEMERALVLALEVQDLSNQQMFVQLRERLSSPTPI